MKFADGTGALLFNGNGWANTSLIQSESLRNGSPMFYSVPNAQHPMPLRLTKNEQVTDLGQALCLIASINTQQDDILSEQCRISDAPNWPLKLVPKGALHLLVSAS